MSEDFILEDTKIKEHFDSNSFNSISSESNSNFQSNIDKNKRDEKIFLKQFNTDFEKYKSYVKDTISNQDQIDESNLNKSYNSERYLTFPYNIYTRFPMIVGIMLIIFGIMICFIKSS